MDISYLVIEGNIGAGKTSFAHKISAELNAKLEKISLSELSKKTIGKKDFWTKESKSKFASEKIARRKLRNMQFDVCRNVITSYNSKNFDACKTAIDKMIEFYNANCNHENFAVLTNKNAETGKNVSVILSAFEIKKRFETAK